MVWTPPSWIPPSGGSGGASFIPPGFTSRDQADCCAPVTILTPDGLTLATIVSGGTFTPDYFKLDVTARANGSGVVVWEVMTPMRLEQLDNEVNVTSTTYYKNNVVQARPFSAVAGDMIRVVTVSTNNALDATFSVVGLFYHDPQTAFAPYLGGNGSKRYTLNQVPAPNTVTVTDQATVGYPTITTIALTAGVTYGSVFYRPTDNCVYAIGQNGVNSMVVSRIDTVTDTVAATTTFGALTNIGFGFPVAVYNYIEDCAHIMSQGGADCALVRYEPSTNTASFIRSINFLAWTSGYYMGYADKLKNSFVVSGSSPTTMYRPLSGSTYRKIDSYARSGSTGVVFNRTNRKLYVTEFNGGAWEYNPTIEPSTAALYSVAGMRQGGLCHDFVANQIFGSHATSLQFGWFNFTGGSGSVVVAAVGAETAFKQIFYDEYTNKIMMLSRGGNIIRVIDPATRALDATTPTINVGSQNTTLSTGFNCSVANKLFVY